MGSDGALKIGARVRVRISVTLTTDSVAVSNGHRNILANVNLMGGP